MDQANDDMETSSLLKHTHFNFNQSSQKTKTERVSFIGVISVWTHSLAGRSPISLGGLVVVMLHPSVHLSVALSQ